MKKQYKFKIVQDDGYVIKDNGHTMFPENVVKILTTQKNTIDKLSRDIKECLTMINKWDTSFKNSLKAQQYEVSVFELLNQRYREGEEILKKHRYNK